MNEMLIFISIVISGVALTCEATLCKDMPWVTRSLSLPNQTELAGYLGYRTLRGLTPLARWKMLEQLRQQEAGIDKNMGTTTKVSDHEDHIRLEYYDTFMKNRHQLSPDQRIKMVANGLMRFTMSRFGLNNRPPTFDSLIRDLKTTAEELASSFVKSDSDEFSQFVQLFKDLTEGLPTMIVEIERATRSRPVDPGPDGMSTYPAQPFGIKWHP